MIVRALNQKTARHHSFTDFLDLAQSLGCVGVELRNDLGRPLFDGINPAEAGRMAGDRGLRLIGLSEVHSFNKWSVDRASQIQALVDVALASGAETITLIPRVDGRDADPPIAGPILRDVLEEIAPLLQGTSVTALIEPIGFRSSSLKYKADLVTAIIQSDTADCFKLVHDTFQHALAGETTLFAAQTGLVHISGVVAPGVALTDGHDTCRGVVDEQDSCDTIRQIKGLLRAGYNGPFSFECTSDDLQRDPLMETHLRLSFYHIDACCALS